MPFFIIKPFLNLRTGFELRTFPLHCRGTLHAYRKKVYSAQICNYSMKGEIDWKTKCLLSSAVVFWGHPVRLSVCLYIYLSVYLWVLSVFLSVNALCLSVSDLSVFLSNCLSICLSIYLSVYLSMLSACLSILSVWLPLIPTYLSVLSVCLYLSIISPCQCYLSFCQWSLSMLPTCLSSYVTFFCRCPPLLPFSLLPFLPLRKCLPAEYEMTNSFHAETIKNN
jgi:hypothetical protein